MTKSIPVKPQTSFIKLDPINSRLPLLKIHWLVTSFALLSQCRADVRSLHALFNSVHVSSYSRLFNYKPRKLEHKSLYLLPKLDVRNSQKSSLTPVIFEKELLAVFKGFILTNLTTSSHVLRTHPSWTPFFIQNNHSNLVYLNLGKFFTRWRRLYYLLFNVFFFKLRMLYFGNIFFKKEISALNWNSSTHIKSTWRYISPFLFLKPIKIFNQGWLIFYKFRLEGYNLAFVVDINFHKKTSYYIQRSGMFSIGLVPINYSINSLDISIPTSSDSLHTQLFFINFISLVRKSVEQYKFHQVKSQWHSFYSNL